MKENLKQVPVGKEEKEVGKSVTQNLAKKDVTPNVGETDEGYNVEVIRDYYGEIDIFHLPIKDPEYVCRFLRFDDKNLSLKTNNLLHSKGGWQICNRAYMKKRGIGDRFISPDGLYHVGDTVLARIPTVLYQEKMEVKQRRANEPMNAINRTLKSGVQVHELAGGIHDSMKGIQTKEDLKGNWK